MLVWVGFAGPLAATCLSGQSTGPKNLIKINPLSLVASTLNLKLEHALNKRFTGQVGVYVGGPRLKVQADSVKNGIQYFLFGITPELRYYISFNRFAVPKGLFVAAFCKYILVRERYQVPLQDPERAAPVEGVSYLRRHGVSLGFLLGYQFVTSARFGIDVFAGPQYSSTLTKSRFICSGCDGNETALEKPGLSFDGIQLRAGLGLGYAF